MIVNNIKEETTPSCKIYQEQRDTQVLTNVWAHQVFKCLAYVDTMRVMNTKMLSDMQGKLLNLKLFTNVYFEEIPN